MIKIKSLNQASTKSRILLELKAQEHKMVQKKLKDFLSCLGMSGMKVIMFPTAIWNTDTMRLSKLSQLKILTSFAYNKQKILDKDI